MNSSITELSLYIIILRIFLSTIIGGIIGYERGSNNQAAGFRTHILVCLGATLISLIQEQLKINLLNKSFKLSGFKNRFRSFRGSSNQWNRISWSWNNPQRRKNNSRTNYSCFSLGYRVHRTWNRMGILQINNYYRNCCFNCFNNFKKN